MIVLITGVPGSGKTLYAVSRLLQESFAGRTVYVNNIKNLLLPHEVLSGDDDPPEPESDVLHWFDGRVPVGSVIVIDEAQRVFRPRSATAPVPAHVSKLETHRHMGLDFVLITQHPQLIDANVRRLVGRHLHVRRAFGLRGALVYEWDHCHMSIDNVRQAAKSIFRYKKKDFALYKSAEVHTKPTNKVPFIVKLFLLLLLLLPVVAYMAYQGMTLGSQKEFASPVDKDAPADADLVSVDFGKAGGLHKEMPMTTSQYLAMFEPRIDGVQHTAPRYDELTNPQRVPLPAACMSKKDDCKCFTQDGTPYKTTIELCREIVANGIFLDFTDADGQLMADGQQVQQPLANARTVQPFDVSAAASASSGLPAPVIAMKSPPDGRITAH